MFELNYTLNENDYLDFNKHHTATSPSGKKQLLLYRAIAPIFLIAFYILYFYITKDFSNLPVTLIFIIVFSIIWVVFSKRTITSSLKKRIKALEKDGRLPYSPQGTLIFDDEFISDVNTTAQCKVAYSSVEKIFVTEKAIYIYFSAMQAYIVPKSCFKDENEEKSLINFIYSKAKI